MPNDATRVAALLSGQLDLITPTPLQDIDRIRREPTVKVVEAEDLRMMFLGFNIAAGHASEGGGPNPLSDRRVRQAMAMVLDIGAITRTVMRGFARAIWS